MHLTLIVPELIWPEPDDGEAFDALDCPALRTILRRSQLERRPPQSFEATLYDAFGHSGNTPYAALRRLGESTVGDANGHWLCSDPVHLRYHEELLILADSGSFELTLDEAVALAEALNAHFSELGRFHVAAPGRWYLQLNDGSALDTVGVAPLSNVAGRALDHERPVTAAQKALHRLLAEIQMLLHTHPVNQKCEAAGRMPINSLWLWGSGPLPEPRTSPFDTLWSSNNALAVGLARHAGTRVREAARDAAEILAGAEPGSRHAVVLEELLAPVQYQKREAYREALADLETRWFAPLHAALRNGRLKQLRIEASTAYGLITWECGRADLWAFWKRPVPLATTAKELAKS